ncbi:hypothetical protein A1O3_06970 [Capronia epimyces CBS 606.96]|uniref:Enoyl reductase (ER) domain-containing protein n=1 Tax=Capronia epimyces CBS 606.96 TaxID=1182542 RepID=W9XUJ9_9EURO|nr:uncharacterized protein A1O3_06970 [Capronia epimyces CBS 606.96]EXJ80686.1 hypothetical protein A1O3_06970 [Capronia epimyces CBS 606.96]
MPMAIQPPFADKIHFQEQKAPSHKTVFSVTAIETQSTSDEIQQNGKTAASTCTIIDLAGDAEAEAEAETAQEEQPDLNLVGSKQRALVITPSRAFQIIHDFPVPRELAPGDVMIRNKAAGLNHIDWKSVEYNFCLPELPWIIGREMAGVVERVGTEVTNLKPGDHVWTSTYYRDRRAGCFQDLVVVPHHTVFLIPSNLDFHAAAILGVAGLTAAMTLWRWLGVPMHPDPAPAIGTGTNRQRPEVLLIWGGSTVTGQFAIQLAARVGVEVIAVCSGATAPTVSSLGATHIVTYTGKTHAQVVNEIVCLARRRLTKAIDLVGSVTANLVLQVVAACDHDQPVDFAPLAYMSGREVVPSNVRLHVVEMKQFVMDSSCRVYGAQLNHLIEQGAIKLPEVSVLQGGVDVVEEGLRQVKEGNLAGRKLVVSWSPSDG